MSRVALITTELPAFLNAPTAGGGVRAWGIGSGLSERGHEVLYFVVQSVVDHSGVALHDTVVPFLPENLPETLTDREIDVAVFEQWQPLAFLSDPLDIPTIVDLPGPLLLEYLWREPEAINRHIADKIRCLSLADTFLLATPRQDHYYAPWLLLAGVDLTQSRPLPCPFGLSLLPKCRQGVVVDEPTFFFGGVFWPWQNPVPYLRAILERMTKIRRGQLVIAGGAHPYHQHAQYKDDCRDIFNHPHVSFVGTLPFNEFIGELRHATVAVDLGMETIERQLACPLRTGVALWSGTPVFVNSHSAWAEDVEEYKAGWVVPNATDTEFTKTIDMILKSSVDIKIRRQGTRSLATSKLNAYQNVAALDEFIQNPRIRRKSPPRLDERTIEREGLLREIQQQNALLMHEKCRIQSELDSIRSKPLFRLYKKIRSVF